MSEKNKKKVIDNINKIGGIVATSGANCIKLEIPNVCNEKILPINGAYQDDYVDYARTLLAWRTGTEKTPKKTEELDFI